MDLGTVKKKLGTLNKTGNAKSLYNTVEDFAEDIRLIFSNAKLYNKAIWDQEYEEKVKNGIDPKTLPAFDAPGGVYHAAIVLLKLFEDAYTNEKSALQKMRANLKVLGFREAEDCALLMKDLFKAKKLGVTLAAPFHLPPSIESPTNHRFDQIYASQQPYLRQKLMGLDSIQQKLLPPSSTATGSSGLTRYTSVSEWARDVRKVLVDALLCYPDPLATPSEQTLNYSNKRSETSVNIRWQAVTLISMFNDMVYSRITQRSEIDPGSHPSRKLSRCRSILDYLLCLRRPKPSMDSNSIDLFPTSPDEGQLHFERDQLIGPWLIQPQASIDIMRIVINLYSGLYTTEMKFKEDITKCMNLDFPENNNAQILINEFNMLWEGRKKVKTPTAFEKVFTSLFAVSLDQQQRSLSSSGQALMTKSKSSSVMNSTSGVGKPSPSSISSLAETSNKKKRKRSRSNMSGTSSADEKKKKKALLADHGITESSNDVITKGDRSRTVSGNRRADTNKLEDTRMTESSPGLEGSADPSHSSSSSSSFAASYDEQRNEKLRRLEEKAADNRRKEMILLKSTIAGLVYEKASDILDKVEKDTMRVSLRPGEKSVKGKRYTEILTAAPFMQPVDAQALGLLDYHDVIPFPMDLGTIRQQVDRMSIATGSSKKGGSNGSTGVNDEDSEPKEDENVEFNAYESIYALDKLSDEKLAKRSKLPEPKQAGTLGSLGPPGSGGLEYFMRDMDLMFQNCFTYNSGQKGKDICAMASQLQSVYRKASSNVPRLIMRESKKGIAQVDEVLNEYVQAGIKKFEKRYRKKLKQLKQLEQKQKHKQKHKQHDIKEENNKKAMGSSDSRGGNLIKTHQKSEEVASSPPPSQPMNVVRYNDLIKEHCTASRFSVVCLETIMDPLSKDTMKIDAQLAGGVKRIDIVTSRPFSQPVDPVKLGIPDYFDKIKNPMDLGTIRSNLELIQHYGSDFQKLVDDLKLVWSNCLLYNSDPVTCKDIRAMANRLKDLCERPNETGLFVKAKKRLLQGVSSKIPQGKMMEELYPGERSSKKKKKGNAAGVKIRFKVKGFGSGSSNTSSPSLETGSALNTNTAGTKLTREAQLAAKKAKALAQKAKTEKEKKEKLIRDKEKKIAQAENLEEQRIQEAEKEDRKLWETEEKSREKIEREKSLAHLQLDEATVKYIHHLERAAKKETRNNGSAESEGGNGPESGLEIIEKQLQLLPKWKGVTTSQEHKDTGHFVTNVYPDLLGNALRNQIQAHIKKLLTGLRRDTIPCLPSISQVDKPGHADFKTCIYFLNPVNEELVPGYSAKIPNPMDLATMGKKNDNFEYGDDPTLKDVYSDLRQIIENCLTFNYKIQADQDLRSLAFRLADITGIQVDTTKFGERPSWKNPEDQRKVLIIPSALPGSNISTSNGLADFTQRFGTIKLKQMRQVTCLLHASLKKSVERNARYIAEPQPLNDPSAPLLQSGALSLRKLVREKCNGVLRALRKDTVYNKRGELKSTADPFLKPLNATQICLARLYEYRVNKNLSETIPAPADLPPIQDEENPLQLTPLEQWLFFLSFYEKVSEDLSLALMSKRVESNFYGTRIEAFERDLRTLFSNTKKLFDLPLICETDNYHIACLDRLQNLLFDPTCPEGSCTLATKVVEEKRISLRKIKIKKDVDKVRKFERAIAKREKDRDKFRANEKSRRERERKERQRLRKLKKQEREYKRLHPNSPKNNASGGGTQHTNGTQPTTSTTVGVSAGKGIHMKRMSSTNSTMTPASKHTLQTPAVKRRTRTMRKIPLTAK
eukprot:g1472.t1